jgi:thiol:disulfide interchange protein
MLLGMIVSLLITLVVALCYILVISFTIWMIIDAGKQDRFWWLVCIIGLPVIGPSAYYFTEKKHEYAKIPPHHIHGSETEEQHEKAPKKRTSRKPKLQSVVAEATPIVVEKAEEASVENPQQVTENIQTEQKPE